jgi:hypothetical protein
MNRERFEGFRSIRCAFRPHTHDILSIDVGSTLYLPTQDGTNDPESNIPLRISSRLDHGTSTRSRSSYSYNPDYEDELQPYRKPLERS